MGEDELCNSSFNLIVNDINILQQWEVLQWARKDAGNSIVGEVDILQARQVLNLKWNRSIKTYLSYTIRGELAMRPWELGMPIDSGMGRRYLRNRNVSTFPWTPHSMP
jgi:hypothetical protein